MRALEEVIESSKADAFIMSGDISQRARTSEFMRGAEFLDFASRHAQVLVVPGNHDVAWWWDPLGLGSHQAMFARYRRFIRDDLEPVLRLSGLTVVGLNSAQGVQRHTLTLRPRDLSVVGSLRASQWARARDAFAAAPSGDLRVLVLHHNLLRGRLSNRWGLANRESGVQQAASTGADLVLCGHDHEERVERVENQGGSYVVASASTLTDRVRGGGPSSINVIDAEPGAITVTVMEWSAPAMRFETARVERFARGRQQ